MVVFGRRQAAAGRLSAECEPDAPDATSTLGGSGGYILYRGSGGTIGTSGSVVHGGCRGEMGNAGEEI